jgi:hypothetical protein
MYPVTLGLLMAGTAVNAFGKISAGANSLQHALDMAPLYDANVTTSNLNADMLSDQADVAGMGVDFAWSKARKKIADLQDKGREVIAAQRSYFSAGNLDPSFGSPLLAQAITAGRVATDVDMIEAGAKIEEADALTRKANLLTQSAGQRGNALTQLYQKLSTIAKGNADMEAGFFGAASTLLSAGYAASTGGAFGGGSGGGSATTITYGGQTWPAFSA